MKISSVHRSPFAALILAAVLLPVAVNAAIQPVTPFRDGECGKDDVGYHAHPGKHGLTLCDWKKFMDFADAHGWRE